MKRLVILVLLAPVVALSWLWQQFTALVTLLAFHAPTAMAINLLAALACVGLWRVYPELRVITTLVLIANVLAIRVLWTLWRAERKDDDE